MSQSKFAFGANMAQKLRFCAIIAYLLVVTSAVDKNNFKTCEQSSFCRRLRSIPQDQSKYVVNLDSIHVTDTAVEAELAKQGVSSLFKLTVTSLAGNTFRVFVDEVQPLHPRYKVEHVLDGEPKTSKLELVEKTKESVTVRSGDNKVVITASPFKIDFLRNDKVVAVVNSRGLFEIEHLRTKTPEVEGENADATKEDPGAWEENFKSHHDSKPRGPEAVGIDITFPGAVRAYGLPEHADKLALRTTSGQEPYRLYNLDVFEYEVDSTMAIYGAVPVLYAHSPEHTVGVFWLNAAETWVDIVNSKDANVVSSIVNLVSGQKSETRVDTHFMSESGVADLFVMMGPSPKEAVRQYAALTGVAPLPQLFTLAYHQCRWNYNDEDDVRTVVEKFDENDFPVDVMWLDIEYTDGKKYFTWDPIKFRHPIDMQHNLTATGRRLVTIIDPHIKREGGYFLHDDALAKDLYVKTKEGNVYEGWCWPGSSSYLDYFDPKVMEYYKGLYSYEKFPGSTEYLNIWNDMNEPSVFNGPEITMPKDLMHYGGWEHRHVHNIYGLIYTKITYDGLLERTSNRRPFILTRAHFAGSQKYAAVWTGDNAAEWSHLAISYAMCLSEALGGISFCGADIGGFFNNPDVELLQRWYQAGAWLPFYRAHAHIDTKRREPYLFDETVQHRIRNALKLRYAHLPLWYTLFFEHERTGDPVIRPLFYHYPQDTFAVDVDSQLLVGNLVMAAPVTKQGVTTHSVYFPGGATEMWYDIETLQMFPGTGYFNIPVSMDKTPVYYKGGSIIPVKDRPRRASTLTHTDPFSLYIALDANGSATGTLYLDDYQSFEYKKKKYAYIRFDYKNSVLKNSLIDEGADYPSEEWLERVVILGPPKGFKEARLTSKSSGTVILKVTYDPEDLSLTIRKPGVNIREIFSISLH